MKETPPTPHSFDNDRQYTMAINRDEFNDYMRREDAREAVERESQKPDRQYTMAINRNEFNEYMRQEDAREAAEAAQRQDTLQQPTLEAQPVYEQFSLEGDQAREVLSQMSNPDYAAGELFIPSDQWTDTVGPAENIGVLHRGTDGEPFEIPAEQIISIPGATSWQDNLNKDLSYAKRLAKKHDKTPVTGLFSAFVQPDGRVFFRLDNNGAHQAMAARHTRGGKVLANGDISVKLLSKNLID